MSAADDFLKAYTGGAAAAPTPEELPDDIPDMDSDYRAKHKRARIYYPLIDRFAKEHPDVPELSSYAKAMMLRESGGNPNATSSADARGLLQLIPGTYSDMGGDPANAYDPVDNVQRGVKYIAQQYRDFGDWNEALAAYNWGPGNVARNGLDNLPNETANYLKAVNGYKKRLQPTAVEQLLAGDNIAAPTMGGGENANAFLTAYMGEQPALDTFQQQGPININQPQPIAKGMPALQPAQNVAGPVEPPPAPVPFTSVPPQMAGFQPPQKPTAQENLQAAGDRMPISSQEIGSAFTKGALGGAIPGANIPMTERETRSGGQYLGTAAGGLLPALAGPMAIPAMMATSGLGAAARGMDQEGQVHNPMEVGIQAALGGILAAAPAAVGQNIIARVTSGGGIGAVQGVVQEAANKLMQEGKIRQEDLNNPEVWKQIGSSALTGMMFGAHGGGVEAAKPAEIQHPGEMTMPIPEQPSFADRAQQEALQNTKTQFEPYKFDPEGRQEPPIQVPQEGAPATPQGDPNMQREAFLKQAEQYLGPEKANAFKILMGEYLPGGKNASPYNVRLQTVPEVQAADNASALSSKNSSSSLRNASNDMTANGGAGTPGMPVDVTSDPSLRTNTWMGNDPTRQNEEGYLRNTEGSTNEGMSDNVPPPPEEVKPTPFQLKELDKRPDRLPTLRTKIRSILKDRRIYIDDEARSQLGITKGGMHEIGPIFTRDKREGLTLDGVAEIIREQAENGSEFFEGFGDGRNVQATDIADALFSGNQEYRKPTSNDLDHVAATNDFLRNGNADFEGAVPTPARMLENEFETGGMKFKRIKSKDKNRIAYKDEYGGKYDFAPDEQVHVGGEMKAPEAPKEQAPATNPQEEFDGSLFQKGPPKASQEDMFGNKGRVASEGFIKGKGEDKGLEGTPLFEGEKRAEQKKAEEDQQRLFQKDEKKEPAPVFYSQLRKAIEEKMPNAAGPEAIKGLVKANAVKEEEMKWSGLDDLLKTKEGQKLTKKEVLDHLDQNQVEIKEVKKGEPDKQAELPPDAGEIRIEALDDKTYTGGTLYQAVHYNKNGKFMGIIGSKYQTEARAQQERQKYINEHYGKTGTPRYDGYQEPGGKNYRELLLTLPEKKQTSETGPRGWAETGNANSARGDANYRSGHWDEPNVLAHVRFNDRTTPDGKKVLHLEEIQSDWHQAGRKKGYSEEARFYTIRDSDGRDYQEFPTREEADAALRYMLPSNVRDLGMRVHRVAKDGVPDAPFKKTWHEMALRRMLRYAAENGYDYVSWTGGEKQAERYNMSKHVKQLSISKIKGGPDDGKYNVSGTGPDGNIVVSKDVPREELAGVVGKDLAEKALNSPKDYNLYQGLDLKLGGEGMAGFYDKMVPQYLSKYGKKWGAGVEAITTGTNNKKPQEPAPGSFQRLVELYERNDNLRQAERDEVYRLERIIRNWQDYENAAHRDGAGQKFQGIPVTDAMRKSVLEEGQPLFQGKIEQEIKGYTDFDPAKKEFVISLVDGKADVSTLFHEFFHTLEQGGVVSKADRAILTKALEAHGIADPLNAKGAFKEAGAEKVADWWERYLRDGKSPVKELQGVFDKVRNWMVETYRSIKGTRLEGQVPKSVKQVFDRLIEGGRGTETATPEGTRLAQKSGKPSQPTKPTKPTEQLVGPDAPRNQKKSDRDDFMIMEAKAGDQESGYLSNPEKLLFGAADRAYPIKKIQKIYEKEFGLPVDTDSDLKYAINRIYGAAGGADQYIDKHLAPAIEGGTIEGRQYERLMPAESKRLFEYLLARDALWRYDKTEGYEMPNNLSKKDAEAIVREHRELAKKNPAQYEKLEKAGDAMVDYARGLANKKLEIGLWSPEEYQEITKNPYYVPEIRYWAKTLATGKGGGAGLDFATKSKLVRGTRASGENVPVFDPLTSLIHDTHQLAKEGAKHYLGNAIIDMQESSPELQKLITEQEDDYKPKAHEGTFPVRRPRTTHLKPEQEAFAERYQNALYTLEAAEAAEGTSREDQALEHNRRKIAERVAALPPNKRNLLGKDMLDIVQKVEESRQKQKAKRLEQAKATEAEFRALPADQQKLIKRWMKEGKVTNYTVPIELAQAMNAMEPIQYGTLGKILKGTTTLFKKGTVTWNPGFAMINGMRDVQEAYINTGMPPHYAIKGFREFLKKGPLYQQYLERGGAIGNSESGFKGSTTRSSDLRYGRRILKDRFNKVKDPEAWKNRTLKIGEKEYNVGQIARMAEAGLQAGKLPMEAMEAFGHMSEMSTRLGVMKYAMEKLGKNVDQAVDMARHATLDFDQRGGSLNVQRAMDVVPFLNPRIQGTLRTGKRLMDGKKAAQTLALGGIAPMLGLTALNMMNPNYANVSDRDKRYSWVIMPPGAENPILIPKPAAVQVLLNPFQMALEKVVGTSPTSFRQQAIEFMQEVLPVSDPSSMLPPLAKTVIENKINKDIFWNRPIVKEPGREDMDQYDPRTSTTMKRVAEKLNWLPDEVAWLRSPERLQHVSKTMLGGTADNLLFFTDILLGDAKKALRSDYKPVVSRFYKGAEEWQGELEQKQRELMSEIKLKDRSAGSGTEVMQTARAKKSDLENARSAVDSLDIKNTYRDESSKALSGRLHRTGDAIGDKFRELGEVNREIRRVRELIEAVKEKNPDVEYRFLHPPVLKKKATPAPSGATPEASPSPEDATSPSTSETESEEAP